MSAAPLEVEAKLTLRRTGDARAIAALSALGRYQLRILPAQRLRTIYLDTPSHSLARNAVALRLRRHRNAWEATSKWGGKIVGVVHERAELTVPLSGPPRFPFVLPAGPLATRLGPLLGSAPLQPIFTTDIVRQRRALFRTDAPSTLLAELDLDCVSLRPPGRRGAERPYWEVEIELLDGERRDVVRAALLLRRQYELKPSLESKFARGMRVFLPQVRPDSEVQPVTRADSVASAARKVIMRHLARVRRHDPGVRAGDEDAVHDMRVAVRRMMAVRRAFKPGFAKPLRGSLKDEMAWLAQVLGDVRDLDVQSAHLARQKHATSRVGIELLRRHLAAQRTRRRARLKTALESERYINLIATLDAFAVGSSNDGSRAAAAVHGQRALQKALRRLTRHGQRAMDEPTPEHLHVLRIAAKRVRYILEFLKEMTGHAGARLTKALVALQDVLGMQHDTVVAMGTTQALLRSKDSAVSRAVVADLRKFAATQQRDADKYRRRAEKLWKAFSRTLDHDVHAVMHHLQVKRHKA